MKYNASKIRSLLKGGARALALTSVLLAVASCSHDKTDTDNSSSKVEVTTSCTTTMTTSTGMNSTTSSTTTSTATTVTTTIVTETQTIVQENIPAIESQPVYVEPDTEYVEPVYNNSGYPDSDVILLAQLINKEASATYEGKLAVASVVVNRSNYFGQSISDVIYAPNQFTTCYSLGYYTDADYQAAQQILTNGSVNNAFYFDGCHPDCLNHFRDINNNYIGAW